MKKPIAKKLDEIAEKLPLVYEWEEGIYWLTGHELNLTPLGDETKFEEDAVYKIPMPQLRAVEHRKQVKDAFEREGLAGVQRYTEKVYHEYDKCTT